MPQVIRLKSLRYILTSFAILLALITPLWADETEPDEVSRLLRQGEIPQGRRREIYVDARTGEIMLQKLDD